VCRTPVGLSGRRKIVTFFVTRIGRRLTEMLREARSLTAQERANHYVAWMPTAVIGNSQHRG
jgi:hypothetical protein